jgi:hypothetical protein
MSKIIKWLLPKEEKFFDMLKVQSENVLDGVMEFRRLIKDFNKINDKEKKAIVDKIRILESKGDDIAHDIISTLDKTFITPIDKEDIHSITVLLDDVIDIVDVTSKRLLLYKIKKVDKYIVELTEILWKCGVEINKCISKLKKLKEVKQHCINIQTLENESNVVRNKAISNLFNNNKDPIQVIKYRDIYEFLEITTDKGEDIAHVIESIVVKHA